MSAVGSAGVRPGRERADAGSPSSVRAVDFGYPTFSRAGDFVRARAGIPAPSRPRRPWYLDIRGAVALTRLIAAEPVVDVVLTDSPAGSALRQAMDGRTWGVPRNRVCVAVFPVPEGLTGRPSGKRNQALRTALNAADRDGLTVRAVPDADERTHCAFAAARSTPRLDSWASSAPAHAEDDWWVAETAGGELAGIAVVVADTHWASLVTLVGLGDARTASNARFALHHAVTLALSARGVGRLAVLDDSPLLVGPGTRHLQHVLGYRLMRLRAPVKAA